MHVFNASGCFHFQQTHFSLVDAALVKSTLVYVLYYFAYICLQLNVLNYLSKHKLLAWCSISDKALWCSSSSHPCWEDLNTSKSDLNWCSVLFFIYVSRSVLQKTVWMSLLWEALTFLKAIFYVCFPFSMNKCLTTLILLQFLTLRNCTYSESTLIGLISNQDVFCLGLLRKQAINKCCETNRYLGPLLFNRK